MDYQPIENYGIIGDLNTIALVGLTGSIDFMCFPDFDSPSIFAALLDKDKGGSFIIHAVFADMKTRQLYLPDTNVLLTRFLSSEGVGEITDFMPVEELFNAKKLIRRVTTIRGEVTYEMKCKPRFNYARSKHTVTILSAYEMILASDEAPDQALRLKSSVPMRVAEGDVVATFTLGATETADFVLEHVGMESSNAEDFKSFVTHSLFETVRYWQNWIAQSTYKGRWLSMVNRSALVLKLLTSFKCG